MPRLPMNGCKGSGDTCPSAGVNDDKIMPSNENGCEHLFLQKGAIKIK